MAEFHERPELDRRLIARGVENLREFGYTSVDTSNILTDDVFSRFFRSMLEDSLGARGDIDEAIGRLMAEIDREPQP